MKKFFEFSNKIISESTENNYVATYGHIDIFRTPQFEKEVGKGIFRPTEITAALINQIDVKSIKEPIEYLIYERDLKRSFIFEIIPEGTFRHEFLFKHFTYNVESIPHLTKTGQHRLVVDHL